MAGSLTSARRRARWVVPLLVVAAGTMASTFASAAGAKPAASEDKVTICHRTDSSSNPYVQITPDKNGTVDGHDGHDGPVWNLTLKDQHIEWGDIVPPFDFDGDQHYPGKNWDAEGRAIYDNGCKPVVPPAPESLDGGGIEVGGITAQRPGQAGAASAVTTQPRFTG